MANIIIGKVAPVFKGEYKDGTTYKRLDIVYYKGSSYVLIDDTGWISSPDAMPNIWQIVAKKGEMGGTVDGTVGNNTYNDF